MYRAVHGFVQRSTYSSGRKSHMHRACHQHRARQVCFCCDPWGAFTRGPPPTGRPYKTLTHASCVPLNDPVQQTAPLGRPIVRRFSNTRLRRLDGWMDLTTVNYTSEQTEDGCARKLRPTWIGRLPYELLTHSQAVRLWLRRAIAQHKITAKAFLLLQFQTGSILSGWLVACATQTLATGLSRYQKPIHISQRAFAWSKSGLKQTHSNNMAGWLPALGLASWMACWLTEMKFYRPAPTRQAGNEDHKNKASWRHSQGL